MTDRARTSTSNFGVSRRENHDASEFYARFQLPELSNDDTVVTAPDFGDGCILGDARDMHDVPDNSVALVVTSPPYFAGKEYEEALGHGAVPASYAEFLGMLRDVFTECRRVLEPGGRIAVNVANLGRKPYRSLSADVVTILQDLKLLLRGEVIWQKAEGASGNCAWGSFRSATNPVLRDLTERVVIASKGRFDRARSPQQRKAAGLPHESTLSSDEFMTATLDLWHFDPESARRVSHPAPFPVELPERLINLYTYKGDVVLDPFMGSGSALVAAVRTGRRPLGFDTDPAYVDIARERVGAESAAAHATTPHAYAQSSDIGKTVHAIASHVIEDAGFRVTAENKKLPRTGLTIDLMAEDETGATWVFDVSGGFTTSRNGLWRTDAVWRALGRAAALHRHLPGARVLLLTSHLPKRGTEGDLALRAGGLGAFFDAAEILSDEGRARLAAYASGHHHVPLVGFWTAREL
jgi:site-specific DNA-methyltransferase (adenine-specific)